MKITINKKEYKAEFGIDCIEIIGEKIGSTNLSDVFKETTLDVTPRLDKNGELIKEDRQISIKDIRRLSLIVRSAILAAESNITEKEVNDWVLANPFTAMKYYGLFSKGLPGSGEEDKEGNLEAPQKKGQKVTA